MNDTDYPICNIVDINVFLYMGYRMVHNYRIVYENIELRQIEEGDLEYLRDWRNDEENTRYLRKIPYITVEDQKKWFHNYLLNEDDMTFAIIENDIIKGIVGSLSLYNFCEENVEFGKLLIGNKLAHGKGIGVKVLNMLLRFIFDELDIINVYLFVFNNNIAAKKIYEKVGFEVINMSECINGDIEIYMHLSKDRYRKSMRMNDAELR